jgi:hypothetical protein
MVHSKEVGRQRTNKEKEEKERLIERYRHFTLVVSNPANFQFQQEAENLIPLSFFFFHSLYSFFHVGMDLINTPSSPSSDPSMISSLPSPIQPTKVKKILPPNVLLHIFHLLPLSALANVALVSRRFKVLAYDDEIWDDKLDIVLQQEADPLTSPQGKSTIAT